MDLRGFLRVLRALSGRRRHEAGAALRPPAVFGELASVSTRLVDVERMLDRALFTACAAYCYARAAATGTRKADDVITAEIHAAYDRQRRLSREDQS